LRHRRLLPPWCARNGRKRAGSATAGVQLVIGGGCQSAVQVAVTRLSLGCQRLSNGCQMGPGGPHACGALQRALKRRSSHVHAIVRLPGVTVTVPHLRASSARGIDTAPDHQKSASRRRRHATPPARCARGKRSRRAQAHAQRREHASACRRVRASACRTARAAAHASPSAQGRPGSSMISPEAINGEAATLEPAHVVFGTAARCAATHVLRRRCDEWGTRVPASWHRSPPPQRIITRFDAFASLDVAWSASVQRQHPSARSSPDSVQPTLAETARCGVRMRFTNGNGCQAARRGRCTRRDR
jgi:hypothetical protein